MVPKRKETFLEELKILSGGLEAERNPSCWSGKNV
jgi:hypothetical protein